MVGEPRPELGHGYKVHKFCVPHRVLAFKGMRITSVAVGDDFTVAVTEAGEVYSFGCGDWWLGHGTGDENFDEETEEFEGVFLPERIKALDGIPVATVAAADYHTLVLTRCGRVYTWGAMDIDSLVHGRGKEDGNLNELDAEDINFNVPQLMTALLGKRVRSIAAGPEMSCAVTDAGGLYTWGQDACGCLGHGDGWQGVSRPTLVRGLDGIRVVGVSTDEQHTLALAADGSVYAFGEGPGLGLSLVSEGEKMVARTLTPQKNPNLKCMVPP
jgi:alpha-tubulin suppressor-like RCC1 family protein